MYSSSTTIAECGDFRVNFCGTCFLESEYIENKLQVQVSFTIILGQPYEILTTQREENQIKNLENLRVSRDSDDRLLKIPPNNFDGFHLMLGTEWCDKD